MAKASGFSALSIEETSFFCGQTAMLLKSGFPMEESVKALCEEAHERNRNEYAALDEALKQTDNFQQALKIAPILPEYALNMIAIGAAAGTLDDVLQELSNYYLRQAQVRERLRSAITYPAFLTLLMGGVIVVLLFRVLPVFSRILDSMGSDGARVSESIIRLGATLGGIAMVFTMLILLGIAFLASGLHSNKHSVLINCALMKAPPVRRILNTLSAERLASAMAMLIKSGYPMENGLKLASALLVDDESRRKLLKAERLLEKEGSLAESIAAAELFDPLHSRMLLAASNAGMMDSILEKLSEIYGERLEHSIQAGEALIEPALVTLLAIVAGAVLLSVMIPLAGMLAGMV